jgi:hypothetical protein
VCRRDGVRFFSGGSSVRPRRARRCQCTRWRWRPLRAVDASTSGWSSRRRSRPIAARRPSRGHRPRGARLPGRPCRAEAPPAQRNRRSRQASSSLAVRLCRRHATESRDYCRPQRSMADEVRAVSRRHLLRQGRGVHLRGVTDSDLSAAVAAASRNGNCRCHRTVGPVLPSAVEARRVPKSQPCRPRFRSEDRCPEAAPHRPRRPQDNHQEPHRWKEATRSPLSPIPFS